MGGDEAPAAVVAGAVEAARDLGIAVVLVGAAETVRAELARHGDVQHLPLTIVDAPEVVGMDESPLAALRRKPGASIKVAADLVSRGQAHALFSAGHTGATFVAAHAAFGVLPSVERPALAVTVPTRTGSAVLLDAGANLECRPSHLVQFARMGAAYARVALGRATPTVGLLSVGEEPGKGTELIREAHAALSGARGAFTFIGNVEPRQLFSGRADVVVCDGFTGNIALKVGEGVVDMIESMIEADMTDAFRKLRRRVDYAEHGAAPLLGVGALTLVGHGRSSAHAVKSAVSLAARLSSERMVDRLSEALAEG